MEWTVAIGVDTHRDAHVAVAVDRLVRRLGALEFAVDEGGFGELRRFAVSLGKPAFAVEGTGSYGASLARALLADASPSLSVSDPSAGGAKTRTT